MPKVSIIVPNYNHSLYLPKRMESIFNQTYQDFEVILLDDCSTDNSKEIIEQYRNHPKVSQIVYNEHNGGTSYRQWYKGIEYAQCELIWIAESDDWCHPQFLESLVKYFDDSEVVLAFARTKFMYEGNVEAENITQYEPQITNGIEFIRNVMLHRNYILNASMVVFRKCAYLKNKDAPWKDMKLAGDWYLWTLILKEGKTVEVFRELNFCRRHDENATSKFRKLGYDIIEGLEVLAAGKRICNNNYKRKSVFLSWVNLYVICKMSYAPKVNNQVLLRLFQNEPLFFYYYGYSIFRGMVRRINKD